jgi:hypothetical protein
LARAQALLAKHTIELIILKQYPLISNLALTLATRQLRPVLASSVHYHLRARGPLAGYVCLNAYDQNKCLSLTIQARGLLTEEYAYSTQTAPGFVLWYHWYKQRLLQAIERSVYGPHSARTIQIEAVSNALKAYITKIYGTPADRIRVALHDIPPRICLEQKQLWRNAIRDTLAIAADRHVYCYNGSIKPWQCPEQTILYFKDQMEQRPNSFLLILTHDTQEFRTLAQRHTLPTGSYHIMHVPHEQIYQYLAACDTGIIMREHNIINWTSRPTKIIEYQAVGLAIAHNNTIAYLSE